MPGYLEKTIEFTAGPIGNFDAVAEQIDPPLRPMSMTAMMAIHGGGEEYDPTVQDFTETGPRAKADTPVGAGDLTLDLLRYVGMAREHRLFDERQIPNPATGDVTTTIFHMPEERSEATAEYTEILRVARYLQPVMAIAIQYQQERDAHSGALLEPTAIHLNARLGNNQNVDLKTAFTNVSIDDGRDVLYTLANPRTKSLTATSGHARSLSIQRPDFPPSFHHVRVWTQLLQNIVAR